MKAVADIFGFLVAGFGVISLFAAWKLSGHSLSDFALFTGIALLVLGVTIPRTGKCGATPNPTHL
ncbi:MAG: hypothetical protein ACREQ7_14910 [Candidatus Binatia bacterium]